MKHWLLFVAGLLAGGAGGLLLGGMGGKDDRQDGAHVEGNRRAIWSGSGGTGGSLEGRGGRPGGPNRGGRVGGAIGGPARASDLLSYLESLAMVDDFEEVSSESMEVIARYEKTVEGLEDMLQGTSGEAQLEVFEIMSNRDPQAAARWLEGEGALDERDQYVEAVASSMMDHDSDAGIAWYMRQEIATEEGEADRIEHIVGRLANESPGTASTWLEGQPDTPARDGAEVNMARFATRVQDWETSFRWAAEVGNARQQTETVNWVLRRGWDPSKKSMNEQVAIAAEEAGFGAQLNAFLLERIASSR